MTTAGIGIDAGSTTCKVVAVDAAGTIVAGRIEPSHPRVEQQVREMRDAMLAGLGAAPDLPAVATGYGRKLVTGADRVVTEITCHARGAYHHTGTAGTLVDLGGQDSKVVMVGADGRPLDFAMNDKCAAGTGRFLEHTAGRLAVEVTQLGDRSLASPAEEAISSTCTVFAESEIISLIAGGADVDAILRGLHRSLVSRLAALVHSVAWQAPVWLSGGVALNPAVGEMLSESLASTVTVIPDPQLTGAHGAALIAAEAG